MFAMVQGLLTAYHDLGSGPVVVLLHGLGATGESYQPVAEQLSSHYRLIVPDLIGNGRTDKPELDYTPAAMASHIQELLSQLGVADRVVAVVGHSLGACVAIELIARLEASPAAREKPIGPSEVEGRPSTGSGPTELGLVLIDPPPPDGSKLLGLAGRLGGGPRLASFTAAFLPHRELARLWLRFLFADPSRVDDRIVDSYARAAGSRGYAAATVSAVRAMGKMDLPTSAVGPALLVWGEEDPIFRPSGAPAWQARLPRAELLLLPACGHCPLEEAPAAVGLALESFLAKLTPPGASAALPN